MYIYISKFDILNKKKFYTILISCYLYCKHNQKNEKDIFISEIIPLLSSVFTESCFTKYDNYIQLPYKPDYVNHDKVKNINKNETDFKSIQLFNIIRYLEKIMCLFYTKFLINYLKKISELRLKY